MVESWTYLHRASKTSLAVFFCHKQTTLNVNEWWILLLSIYLNCFHSWMFINKTSNRLTSLYIHSISKFSVYPEVVYSFRCNSWFFFFFFSWTRLWKWIVIIFRNKYEWFYLFIGGEQQFLFLLLLGFFCRYIYTCTHIVFLLLI